ncbi:hypothetical protein EON83_08740 [bacterium]|nr:MAG: hypothetical protein EON83_08740 [bacterium]
MEKHTEWFVLSSTTDASIRATAITSAIALCVEIESEEVLHRSEDVRQTNSNSINIPMLGVKSAIMGNEKSSCFPHPRGARLAN